MPVRNANHSIHSYGNGNEKHEILFLEIWTNGSLTSKEALKLFSFWWLKPKHVHIALGYHNWWLSPFSYLDNVFKSELVVTLVFYSSTRTR